MGGFHESPPFSTRNDNGPPNRRLRQLSNRITNIATQVDSLLRKLEENNCRSYPCQNGGVCLDLFDGFLCQCPNNWEGPTCAADVNECARFAGTDLGCQNGASCQNTPGGYNCICADGKACLFILEIYIQMEIRPQGTRESTAPGRTWTVQLVAQSYVVGVLAFKRGRRLLASATRAGQRTE